MMMKVCSSTKKQNKSSKMHQWIYVIGYPSNRLSTRTQVQTMRWKKKSLEFLDIPETAKKYCKVNLKHLATLSIMFDALGMLTPVMLSYKNFGKRTNNWMADWAVKKSQYGKGLWLTWMEPLKYIYQNF